MFGNLLGDFEKRQEAIKEKLKDIIFEVPFADRAIIVKANAARTILSISIDQDKVNMQDKEQVEEMVVEAINRALEEAQVREAAEMKTALDSILPGGLGGLGDLFK